MPGPDAKLRLESLESREVPAVYTVNGLADGITADGELTLREAISLNTGGVAYSSLSDYEKNQVSGVVGTNDQIQFAVTGGILLGGNLPTLTKKLAISGPGADKLTIDGNLQYRPLNVGATGDVTVSGLEVYHAYTADSGAVALNNGKLTLSQVEFDISLAEKHGGAIENNGVLIVDRSYFRANTAMKVGGAIDNNASATITNSTFYSNTANNTGGAIWSNGTLSLSNCTITGNDAANAGGGLRLTGGTVTITSCTITGNDADSDVSGFESGGGISRDGGTVTLNNTVVAKNTRKIGQVKSDIAGLVGGQFNFIGVNTEMNGLVHGMNGNKVGIAFTPLDPMLPNYPPLGVFAPTLLPAAGSPLIGIGAPLALAGGTDQRGVARTEGKTTVGAVEVAVPLPPPPPVSPPPPPVSPPPPAKVDLHAVGAGKGGAPHVRVYNADGSERFSFFAYDPAYTGGVNVATGDVTGDGVDDIVTGTMAGGGPHIQVFDGQTGAAVRSFFAYDPGFRGGVNVGIGDVTGDGHPDIVTGVGSGGGPHVQVFDGVSNAVVKSFMAYDPAFTGGVNVAVGDVNGDGFADIVTGVGSGVGPQVRVVSGKDDTELANFMAYDPAFTGGVRVATADFNGDGKADLLTAPGAGMTTTIKRLTATGAALAAFDAYDPAFQGGVFVG